MLACNKTVTLVHRIKSADGDSYVCTTIPSCSWFSRQQAALVDKGVNVDHVTHVRFPSLPYGAIIEKGDYIVRGVVDHIEREKDLAGLEYFTVLDIADNTRGGGVRLPHWKVSGR